MAIDTAYAEFDAYAHRFGLANEADETLVKNALLLASRYVDLECGRIFGMDAAPTARVFTVGRSGRVLRLDEFAGASPSVKVDTDGDGDFTDETAITGLDVAADGDRNASAGPEPRPWNEIILRESATSVNWFVAGQLAQVTVAYGYPAVPQPIEGLVVELAGIWLIQSPRATGTIDQMGQAVRLSRMGAGIVDAVLQKYKRGAVA